MDDLVMRVRELLGDTERAAHIAASGHARTLREHTSARRSLQVEAVFEELLGNET